MCWERFSEASQRFICSRFHCCCSFFPRRPRRGTRFRSLQFLIDSSGATLSASPGPLVRSRRTGGLVWSSKARGRPHWFSDDFSRRPRNPISATRPIEATRSCNGQDPRLYCSRGPDENILVGEGWTRGLGMGPALLFVAATSEDGGGVQRPVWLECVMCNACTSTPC